MCARAPGLSTSRRGVYISSRSILSRTATWTVQEQGSSSNLSGFLCFHGPGSFGLTAELIETHGPDSYIGELASTMNGSTETTFYVLAVYFGSVGVSRIRHAVPAGLAADLTGVFASVLAVKLLLS